MRDVSLTNTVNEELVLRVGNIVAPSNPTNKSQKPRNASGVSTPTPSFKGFKLDDSFADPMFRVFKQHVYSFSNNMRAIILEKPGSKLNFLTPTFNVGALNESEAQRGIAHLHEHTQFLGAKGEEDGLFNTMCGRFGAQNNAFTSYTDTSFTLGVLGSKVSDIQPVVSPFSNMVISPSFPVNPYEKEKSIVIQEIKEYQNDAENMLKEFSIKRLFGIETEADDLVLGKEDVVQNISREDLFAHQQKYYTPNNLNIYAITGMPHEEMAEFLEKNFVRPDFLPSQGTKSYTPLNMIKNGSIETRAQSKIYSDLIDISFLGPKGESAKEIVAMQALIKILSGNSFSRFNAGLSKFNRRTLGDFDSISNNLEIPMRVGFTVDARHSMTQKVLDSIRKSIDELDSKKITNEELEIAKKSLLRSALTAAQDPLDSIIQMQVMSSSGSINHYKNYLDTITSLNLEDVTEVAKKYISREKANITVFYPEEKSAPKITFTGANTKVMKKYILPNNIRLVLGDDPTKLLSSVMMNWEIPTNHAKIGVQNVLAAMLNKATSKYSEKELAYIKAAQGLGSLFVDPTQRGLLVKSMSLNDDVLASVKLIKEMLFEPNLSKSNFEGAKDEVVSDLLAEELTAGDRAYQAMYGRRPEGITDRLLNQEIENISYEDVLEYYEKLKENSRFNVAVLGKISEIKGLKTDIIDELKSIGLAFKNKKIPKQNFKLRQKDQIVVQYEKGIESSAIMKLFHIDASDKKDIAAISILNKILGDNAFVSRLYKDLREVQELTYGADSYFSVKHGYAQESIETLTGIKDRDGNFTDNIKKCIDGFNKHIKMLVDEPPTQEEVDSAQRAFLTEAEMSADLVLESNNAMFFLLKDRKNLKYGKQMLNEIAKVTPEDVQRVAKKYLDSPSVTSVLTTKEAANKNMSYFKSLGELKVFKTEKD